MKLTTLIAALLVAVSAAAATIAPGDIAVGPPPACWGAGGCITTPPPPYVVLLDAHRAQKWSQTDHFITAFGPNGHLFLSGFGPITEYDGALAAVRTINRTTTSALTIAQNGDIYALAFDGVLTIYTPAGAVKQTIALPFTTGSLLIPPSLDVGGGDPCTLFYTDGAHAGRRYDVCNNQPLANLAPGSWNAVRAMSDGGYVAASGSIFGVFDAQNHLLRHYTPQIEEVNALAFDTDPNVVIAGTATSIVRIRLSDGTRIENFYGSVLYLAVNGEQRASAAALVIPSEVPALSSALLLALAVGLVALAWLRLR